MNSPIASDLSYEVSQLRCLRAQQGLESMDSTLATLQPIPGAYEDFFPSGNDPGDRCDPNPLTRAVGERDIVPTWHVRK